MSRTAGIAVIAVVAVVAFGGAYLVFSGDDDPGTMATGGAGGNGSDTDAGPEDGSDAPDDDLCGATDARPVDGSGYEVTVASEPDPPTPRGSTFEVLVQRDGQPVSDATVCMALDMADMSHGGTGGQADETAAGRYEVGIDFGMRGTWEGTVFVSEPGEEPVAAAVTVDVE